MSYQQQQYQYQPIQNVQYNYPEEEVVQGVPISLNQVNLNQNTGVYQQQVLNNNQLYQYQQPMQQQLNNQQQPIQQQYIQQQQYQQQQQQLNYPQFDQYNIQQQQYQQQQEQVKQQQKEEEQKQIFHTVTPNDTLIGLSIRYNVSEFALKKFNNLDGDDIQHKKQLKIPNPKSNLTSDQDNYDMDYLEKKNKISDFQRYVLDKNDKSEKLANYYLSEANWDYNLAQQQYNEDLQWEKQNSKK